jgi:hypothetical protein
MIWSASSPPAPGAAHPQPPVPPPPPASGGAQGVPECWHPVAWLQVSVVQASWSSQLNAEPGTQAPPWHRSPWVQLSPSLQAAPLGAAESKEQVPVAGSHVPGTRHWPAAVHITGLRPVHMPLWQMSICVQALPSLQDVPLRTGGLEQVPVAGSHVPGRWH